MTLSAARVRDLLASHDLHPSRALGQNFVADANTVRKVVRLAGVAPGERVLEIGPGLGSLTLALVEAGALVTAVETDRHLLPVLETVLEGSGVTLVHADAMQLDWPELLGDQGSGWVMVSNLPYNIATPLVIRLLESAPAVTRMLVMVQREVGERLAASPGQASYGIPSVAVTYWAEASVVARVPPTVFVPRPKVESVLVSIRRRPEPAVPSSVVSRERLFTLVRAGFGQRRKMLRRSLAGLVGDGDFVAAGVDPAARAEDLDVVAWGRLAAARSAS